MSSAKLDLVRSIYAHVERGDWSTAAEWADPEIEWVWADGPEPGTRVGVAQLERGLSDVLDAWRDYRVTVEQYLELDDERVLVLLRRSGRGKTSGLELEQLQTKGANLFHIRSGKVTRLVQYFDRERALADLGLAPESG
jgi:ketosteroid isomerase-like protein